MMPHNKPSLDNCEAAAISEVLKSGWIAPGEKVRRFEQVFTEYVGAKYAIAVNSGTAALYVALKIMEIQGNLVMPTYACSALLNAALMARINPILEDIDRESFNMKCGHSSWTYQKAARIVVHTFGVPLDIEKIKLSDSPIIEDCSQALGSYINDQHVGLQGDIGIFSFGPSKMITTGSGGMIITNDKSLADRARDFIDYDKRVPAFNFAMNDIQAAMGIEQMKKLPTFLRRREYMAMQYIKCILDTQKYWAVQVGNFNKRNWYRFVIADEPKSLIDRLKQHLADNGITAIVPIRQDELLHNMLGLDSKQCQNAEYIAGHSLSLPIFPALTDEEFSHIIETLRRF
jgi:perosamine synthetase